MNRILREAFGFGLRRGVLALALAWALLPVAAIAQSSSPAGFINHGLIGIGRLPADLRDKFGETTVSSSSIAADPKMWRRDGDTYHGVIYQLPDRGWNTTGTIDYRPRLHKLSITFRPATLTAGGVPPQRNAVAVTLADTILLTDANGEPLTGLDPDGVRPAANGFPGTTASVSATSEALTNCLPS